MTVEKSKYYDTVNSEIDEIIKTNMFGFNFEFVEGQRNVVTKLCTSFLEWRNNETTVDSAIVYAPTGYGKSIIAMFTSKILQKLGYGGYVLTVDLMLQQQYENDFKKFKLNFHSIKGTTNYRCSENGESFKKGECHSMSLSYKQLRKLKCYNTCAYLQARNRAIRAPISLLNYQYWLMQRNHVARKLDFDKVPFGERDFAFFDECHKLDDIVQGSFSIKIKDEFPNSIENMNQALLDNGYHLPVKSSKEAIDKIIKVFKNSNSKADLRENLIELQDQIFLYTDKEDDIKDFMSLEVKEGSYVPDEWKRVFNIMDQFNDLFGRIEDYIEVTDEVGLKNLIIRVGEEDVEFVSLRDDFLIKKYVLKRSGFKIFMSATLGKVEYFIKTIGLEKTLVLKLKNQFNYDKSPIYFMKGVYLDYKNKKENIGKAIKIVDQLIATKHINDNGIIHTGSYEFTRALMVKSRFRRKFIDYNSSNKRSRVKKFLASSGGKILVGPSLLEGLDLKGDLSRFQIFLKIPYPSINDPLVKAKLKENQDWYNWRTSVGIIQGANRSIRSKNDWSLTYVIPHDFMSLIKKKLFDIDFIKRLKEYDYILNS